MKKKAVSRLTGRAAGLAMAAAAFSVFLASCASVPSTVGTVSAGPQDLIENDQAVVVFTGLFFLKDEFVGKFNGEPVTARKSVVVDVSKTGNEVMFAVGADFRGLVGAFGRSYVRGSLNYEFAAGKAYNLVIRETTGSKAGAFFIGALMPRSYEMALYEYNGRLINGYDKNRVLYKTGLRKENKQRFIAFAPPAGNQAPAAENAAPVPAAPAQAAPLPAAPLPAAQVPQSGAPRAAQAGPSDYFVSVNNQPTGPHSFEELKKLAETGQLRRDSLVWKEGMGQWAAAGRINEFDSLFVTPPPLPPPLPPR
jgi:hypothetical protein